ncbi:MAG: metallophosphoesterase, partial [Armatimonadia bacterium]|nr:metallophosphoesterase [Armatimonadia bacterium]
MRLVAIADLHYDDDRGPRVEALAAAVKAADADLLIV